MKKAFSRFFSLAAWVLAAFCLLCCIFFIVQGWPRGGKAVVGTGAAQAMPALYEGDARLTLLNSMTAEALTDANGIGNALADKIIAARAEKNGFSFIEELQQVPGVGEKKYQAILSLLEELLAGQ